MIELLEKISRSTSYLAVAGTVAVMFLLIFAQSIFGSRTTHSQLRKLLGETERMNEKLERIARQLAKDGESPCKEGPEESGGEAQAKRRKGGSS